MKRRSNFARFGEYLNTYYPVKTKDDGDEQSQTQAILSRFHRDNEQGQIVSDVFDTFMGAKPLRKPLPDDMPAIERIKIYAQAGYKQYHIGTDEDFERVWEEAFKEESKFKFLADTRREKGGKK